MFTGIVSAVAKVVEADGKRIGIDHAGRSTAEAAAASRSMDAA
jgi:hypothetical protein